MGLVVALDAGTTGVRALAIDETSSVVGLAYRELTQHFPRPGWVEHDLDEIWTLAQAVLAELVESLSAPVAAIGITNQRETVAAWDRSTGQPRHRAIVWQDRRTAGRCDAMSEAGHLDLVRAKTGLVLDPYFSGTKFEWLLANGVAADADLALGTIDSWLIWNLTGGTAHATEPSNASRTLLFDITTLEWSPELCDLLSIPMAALPTVVPSSGRFGVTANGATALPAGIPISGAAGDQQSALFGQACFEPGMTKNTYGTGSFVLMNVGARCPEPVDGLLTTVGWTLSESGPAAYAYEGAIFVTGAAVQWLRDGLGIISEAAEIGPLAASVEDTGDVYCVPAFTGLGSPWWDPYARGTLVGLTRGTGRAELARAVVEAMAYQTRDVVELMTKASGQPLAELRVDGGASAMDLLLQLQADQLGVPVARPSNTDTTAVGAAYLAGLAEGVWSSADEVSAAWSSEVVMQPDPDRAAADSGHRRWLQAVDRSRNWAS
ncbi:MAG: glycerol kinase GlpK [Actinomycetia bacterium]|nr:glycerol kinase GlpK [Actinomycetes bacterium]MCP4224250.1 glycerol kinase GlpK [Actinomycetes bacterium]MCP5032182.1 glycerol kinase GlpK [Actinomycetes bacterium]